MDLRQLFQMQKQLDTHIETTHQLENEDLFDRKVLALLVELSELANETRCFKFWSLKPSSEKQVILEEFVDGVHFMLSLGLEQSFEQTLTTIEVNTIPKITVSEQFLQVYEAVHQFRNKRSIPTYENMFRQLLMLGEILGFSGEEIYEAYIEKNKVNFERQQQGY